MKEKDDFDTVLEASNAVYRAALNTGRKFGISPTDMAAALAIAIRRLAALEPPPELYQERLTALARLVDTLPGNVAGKRPQEYNYLNSTPEMYTKKFR